MKKHPPELYRVLDANANRLREALRVCEDVARFVLLSPSIMKALKTLRHDATKELMRIPEARTSLIAARDSEKDSGRRSLIKGGRNLEDMLLRNFKRAEEASRVLEEFLKIISPSLSPAFQQIRFRIYDLEKKTFTKFAALRRH